MADGKRRYKSDRKDHKVSVKLSEKDMDILKAALNRTGMTASAYIRELIRTGGNIDTSYPEDRAKAIRIIAGIAKHSDKVVNVEECGPNVLKIIFTMDNIKIYMSRPSLFDIPDDVQIRFNDSDIVTGGRGYNAWWGKEYERREADDL